jgi:hypothetical protein
MDIPHKRVMTPYFGEVREIIVVGTGKSRTDCAADV